MRAIAALIVAAGLILCVTAPAPAQKLRGEDAREARNALRDIRREWRTAHKAEKYDLLQRLIRWPENSVTGFLESVASGEDDDDVASWAVYVIARHNDPGDIRNLIRLYQRARTPERQGAIVRWLGLYGEEAPIEQLKQIAMEDTAVARPATHAIADAETDAAWAALADVAASSANRWARRAAAARLLNAGHEYGIKALETVQGLEDAAFAANYCAGTELETPALLEVIKHAKTARLPRGERPHYFGSFLARLQHIESHEALMAEYEELHRRHEMEIGWWMVSVNRTGIRLRDVARWIDHDNPERRMNALRALQRQPEPFEGDELEATEKALLPLVGSEDDDEAAHAMFTAVSTGALAEVVAEKVEEWLEDDKPLRLAAALLVAGQAGLSAHGPRAIELLEHETWYVVSAALDCLLHLRPAAAAPALLALARRLEEGRIYSEALVLLEDLTGQQHGDLLDRWEEWLEENEDFTPAERQLESLRGVPHRQMRQATGARFYGIELLSTNMQFTVDRSVSMAFPVTREPTRPDYRRQREDILRRRAEVNRLIRDGFMPRLYVVATEMQAAMNGLSQTSHYGITLFSHEILEHKRIQNTPDERHQAYNWLISTEPSGGTDIQMALLHVIEAAEADSIVLLTDGDPLSVGILELVHRANAIKRLNIDVVSIHEEIFHRHYMQALAEREYGRLVDAEPLEGFEDR
jgi:hypothetical protein